VEDEDFGNGWGDMDDDPADSWADDLQKSSQAPSHSTKTSTSTVPFDDGGEPDFEGWLNAQAAAKSQSKKPLPKGLAKKSTPATTAAPKSAPPARTSNVVKPASTSAMMSKSKVTENKAAAEEDDDDWGDAWG
jgi:SCY1-like protein 1